jgi:hypothetical protein
MRRLRCDRMRDFSRRSKAGATPRRDLREDFGRHERVLLFGNVAYQIVDAARHGRRNAFSAQAA